jgi:DNA-binding transcriptional ArsR family regulator
MRVSGLDPKISLFGSRRRTEVLILLALLEESFPSELARLLAVPLFTIQRVLSDLEDQGIVAARVRGRTRLVSLNPRFFACNELRQLLHRLAEGEPELESLVAGHRTRPVQRRRIT